MQPTSEIVVTGPFSRTWYSDQGCIQDLLEWFTSLGLIPIVIGDTAFQACARAGASGVEGAVIATSLPGSPEADLALKIATLCVAYVGRKGAGLEACGPTAVDARGRGIPVLALHVDGHAEMFR